MPAQAPSSSSALEASTARRAAAAAAQDDPLDCSLAQVGKYRPRVRTVANRVVTDVTSAEQMVLSNAARLAQKGRITIKDPAYQEPRFPLSSQDVTSPRMTRMGKKWRGGTPAPQPNDKAFSQLWWISSEATKCVKQDRELKQATAQRMAEVERVLAQAKHYDSTGASAAAIQAAHATASRLSSKSARKGTKSAPMGQTRGRSKSHLGHAERSKPAVEGVAEGGESESPQYGGEGMDAVLPPRPHTRQGIGHGMGGELGVRRPEQELEPMVGDALVDSDGTRPRTSGSAIRPRTRGAGAGVGDRGAGGGHGQVVKGGFGNLNKYVPHFRLADRPKTAEPVRDGWGLGVHVFPEKKERGEGVEGGNSGTETRDASSSIYQQWETVDWAKEKKHHVRRSDVRSQHMNRLRYGGKVIRADAPESATENTLLETSTSRSPSWIRKGLSRANNNVEFWSKLHNTPGWAGQRASAVPFRATGGPWVAAKTDASAVSGGGESDDHDGGVVCGGRGYKKRGACLTEVLGLQDTAIPSDTPRICTDKNEVWLRRYRKSSERHEVGQDSVSSLMVHGIRDVSTPLQLKFENRKFHEEFPGEYDSQSKTYVVPKKWRSKMAEEAYGGVGIKSNYKLGQTQAPKAPFVPGDWPLHHKNNMFTTEDIHHLKRTLLPDRRAPPEIIPPNVLRKQEEAKLAAQLSAISSDD